MKQLLEDILYTLNQLPDRKVKGKDFTTHDLAKRVEEKLAVLDTILILDNLIEKLKQTDNE